MPNAGKIIAHNIEFAKATTPEAVAQHLQSDYYVIVTLFDIKEKF